MGRCLMMVSDLKQKSVKKQFGIPNSRLFAIIKNRDRILELFNQASFNQIENISVRLPIKAQMLLLLFGLRKQDHKMLLLDYY